MDQNLTFKTNGKRLEIHPDLVDTFEFIIKIDQENKYLLDHFDKAMNLKKDVIHLLADCATMIKIINLKGENINHQLTPHELSELQDILSEIKRPIRSIMISLFAYMETLFSLLTVYKAGTELNDKQLIEKSKNDFKPFIARYLLNKGNKYYLDHEDYFKELTPQKLVDLRNYLTHFYSVPDNIAIAQDRNDPIIQEMRENQIKCIFIVPIELYELLQSAAYMIIKERESDALNNHEIFKLKMKNVIKIVGEKAAREVLLQRK